MKALRITQAKSNPSGKDRIGNVVPSSQLAGEWVDFMNIGDEPYSLDDVKLQHIAYRAGYPDGVWEEVIRFSGSLPAGETVRVHSGGEIPLTSLQAIDTQGADHHIFTGKNYIWNNSKSDTPRLRHIDTTVDKATYGANPPEGKVLKRNGDYLL